MVFPTGGSNRIVVRCTDPVSSIVQPDIDLHEVFFVSARVRRCTVEQLVGFSVLKEDVLEVVERVRVHGADRSCDHSQATKNSAANSTHLDTLEIT